MKRYAELILIESIRSKDKKLYDNKLKGYTLVAKEFDECLNETYKHDGDVVYDEETGFVYKLLEFESDSEEYITHELEKVQKGDLILMEISGVEKIRKLSSSIRLILPFFVNIIRFKS